VIKAKSRPFLSPAMMTVFGATETSKADLCAAAAKARFVRKADLSHQRSERPLPAHPVNLLRLK